MQWSNGGTIQSKTRVSFGASSWVERAYIQELLGANVNTTFEGLRIDSDKMEYNSKSMDEMKYRGNELRRTKMFFVKQDTTIASEKDRQIATERNCLVNAPVYTYPGFQHASVFTYKDLDTHALIAPIADHCSEVFDLTVNHVIATSYKRAATASERDDLIGPHRDRPDTLAIHKPIIIITYGDDTFREFVVTTNDATEVFRCRTEPGTLIYLSYEDNLTYKHQIVAVKDEVFSEHPGPRGFERVSLVLREINQIVSISDIEKKTKSRDNIRLKRKQERVSWFTNGRYVHNRTECSLGTGTQTPVSTAKGKRFCGDCFPPRTIKRQKLVIGA